MEKQEYVHGYDATEQERLHKQASILNEMTYEYFNFDGINSMLEMGCGTGGQTEIILNKYPNLKMTSVDISEKQLAKAKQNLAYLSDSVHFLQGDVANLDFPDNSFDAVFICWVLEHTKTPLWVLKEAYRLLKPNGKIYITEVHNESMKTVPAKEGVEVYMKIFNDFQIEIGGDPNIGLKLGTMTHKVGFKNIVKRSLHQFHDHSDVAKKEMITTYFKNLYLSAEQTLLAANKITEEQVAQMKADFDSLIDDENGVYYYSPIQVEAQKIL